MSSCPYCGNTSGKRDARGGCVSCGAMYPTERPNIPWNGSSWVTVGNAYIGSSGGFSRMDACEVMHDNGIMSPNELREMWNL